MIAALLACGGPDDPDAALTLTDVGVSASEWVPTVQTVTWTTPAPATSRVRAERDDGTAVEREDLALVTEHEVTLHGLVAGRTYDVVASSTSADGEEASSGVVSVAIEGAPSWVPSFTLSNVDPARHAGGYVLLNVGSDAASGVVIVDREGDPVWWAEAGEQVLSTATALRRDGSAVILASQDLGMGGAAGTLVEVALDGSWRVEHPAPGLHHAFAELPSGELAFVSAELAEVDGVRVIEDLVRVVGEDGEVRDLFRALDHFEPAARCSHYAPVAYAEGATDWLHANGLAWDEAAGALYLMARNWDALVALDPDTGSPLRQIGGSESALDWAAGAEDPWDHAHHSVMVADGVALLDNGAHRDPEWTRAAEYGWSSGELELVWEYWDPEGRSVPALGDVRRLDGGNRLVAWGTLGFVTELADQDVVWQADAEVGYGVGWVQHLAELP
ncbi:MAG: aryl-sulfate sulfotransferase [Myxococcota bacterium]